MLVFAFPAKQKCKSSNMGIVVSLLVCKNSRDGIGKKFFNGENSDENCMITRRNISLLNTIHEALYTRYKNSIRWETAYADDGNFFSGAEMWRCYWCNSTTWFVQISNISLLASIFFWQLSPVTTLFRRLMYGFGHLDIRFYLPCRLSARL